MTRTGRLCLFLLPLIVSTSAFSQANPVKVYSQSNTADFYLYNGPLYAGYNLQTQGHPFFQTDTQQNGSVTYRDIYFPDIPLFYDLEKDLVIIPDKRNVVKIQLLPEKLSAFTIGEHHFIRLTTDSTAINAPDNGYYEVLSPKKGKATALAHYKKIAHATAKVEENPRYQQYDNYFLRLNNRYYPIHNERDLTRINNNLKNYLKTNHISFRKDPATTMIKAAEFYSQN